MRVGITAELLLNAEFTGIENYICNLSENLSLNKTHDINLILPLETLNRKDSSLSIFHYSPPLSKIKLPFQSSLISSLINYPIGLKGFNAIHVPTVTAPFFFRPPEVKVVMTVHDIIPNLFPKWQPLKRRLYFKYFLKHRFKFVDRFIAVSENTKKDMINLFNIEDDKIDVIYEGVSKRFKKEEHQEKREFVLAVSTLEPRKNFTTLIHAFIRCKEKHNIKEKLLIVGRKGWLLDHIRDIPKQYARDIIFKGYVSNEELVVLYQQAKLFIYPSMYEGFGLPVLEAMACGCPVITNNCSSIPEVGGVAVEYVDPENVEAFSQIIFQIISSPEQQKVLSDKGVVQAKKFTWEKCAHETINTYEKVLNS
ncbi:MAG: glycosyltransferase family 4 protein [Proteobacteria bacterium]|nr:glycosyltransferase family 4 protein [Pseudomonadota bacterium]